MSQNQIKEKELKKEIKNKIEELLKLERSRRISSEDIEGKINNLEIMIDLLDKV